MPCTYDDFGEEKRILRQQLSETTRLLCEVLTSMSEADRTALSSRISGLVDWWGKHQYQDRLRQEEEARQADAEAKRVEAQARRQAALQSARTKLTIEERIALGIL